MSSNSRFGVTRAYIWVVFMLECPSILLMVSIPLGKLLAQHQRILSPHIIETVFLEWNADAFLEF